MNLECLAKLIITVQLICSRSLLCCLLLLNEHSLSFSQASVPFVFSLCLLVVCFPGGQDKQPLLRGYVDEHTAQ